MMYWTKILLLRHFALSWKTFHKPNIDSHCNKREIGTSLCCCFLFSSFKTQYPSLLNSLIPQFRWKIPYLRTLVLLYPFLILLNYSNKKTVAGINFHFNNKNHNPPQTKQARLLHYLPKEFFEFRSTVDFIFPEVITLPEAWGLTWSLL